MTTFLFNETNGTTLSQIDPNWQGNAANIVTQNGTITSDTRNVFFRTWYTGTSGTVTNVSMQYEKKNANRGQINWLSLQANATNSGYKASFQDDGTIYLDRNDAWIGYIYDLRGVFNPLTTDYILSMSFNETNGTLSVYVNGSLAGTVVDPNTPWLTGGYPGFTCSPPVNAYDQSYNSAWSNDLAIVFPAPNTPSNLVATEINPYSIGLTWTDNSLDETGFVLEQESPSASSNWVVVTTIAANTTSYTVTGLSGSTSYRYRMKANGDGPSSPYVVSNALTTSPPIPLPDAPASVTVSNVTEEQADVAWVDSAVNEDDYLIQVETPNGSGNWVNATAVQNPLPPGSTSATIINLSGSTTYRVRVVARNLGGANSTSSTSFTTLTVTIPEAPTNLIETQVSDHGIKLYWSDNSTNESGFVVQYETPIGQGNWVNATGATNPTAKNATSFAATGLSPSTAYRFRVAATNTAGSSAYALGTGFSTKALAVPYTWVFNQPDGTEITTIDSRFIATSNTIVTNQGAMSQNIRNAVNRALMTSQQGTVQKSIAYVNGGTTSTWLDPVVCSTLASPGYALGFIDGFPGFYRNGTAGVRASSTVDTTTAPYYYSVEFDSATGTLTGKYNGTTVLTWVDPSPLVGGMPGFSVGSVGSAPTTLYPGPLLSWSDGVTPALAIPDAPVGLYVDNVNSTSATLHWTNGDLTTGTFTIERTVVGSNVWTLSSGGVNPTSAAENFHIASAMQSLTQYKFRIKATNSVGSSAWVETAPFTTGALTLVTPMLFMYPF